MNTMIRTLLLLLVVPISLFAQPVLKPHIGNFLPPVDSDSICEIPVFQGNFDQTGYTVGDTVPDFTLFTIQGDSFRLSEALLSGKPVLLVNGNYTCPRYRNKHADLEEMAAFYGDDLIVYVVYTVEAHPIEDPSPYSGTVWVTSENYKDSVLFRQPTTYQERTEIVAQMVLDMGITLPILLDGPCNPWWAHFGPAPNNAYLIQPNGTVAIKQAWFHREPPSMWCDLDTYFGVNSGKCNMAGNDGIFVFNMDTDSLATGQPGSTLDAHGTIQNLSSTDNVVVRIRKVQSSIPKNWETALCADICYTTDVDVTDITIGPSQNQPFTFYFYTGMEHDSGQVLVGFTNLSYPGNTQSQLFIGKTEPLSAYENSSSGHGQLSLFPNPGNGFYHLEWPGLSPSADIVVSRLDGHVVYQTTLRHTDKTDLDLRHLPSGIYVLSLSCAGQSQSTILLKH